MYDLRGDGFAPISALSFILWLYFIEIVSQDGIITSLRSAFSAEKQSQEIMQPALIMGLLHSVCNDGFKDSRSP
jgi:hypothetical protein